VRIVREAYDRIVAHAADVAPAECCGLLLGRADLVDEARPARNMDERPTRYLIDPADHFAAIHAARTSYRRVVGVYHSHPTPPAAPSATDLAEATYPEYVYVIVAPGDVRGFHVEGGAFREEPVTIVDPA
jgi:proteasome lid subunit RPN8/RPN11